MGTASTGAGAGAAEAVAHCGSTHMFVMCSPGSYAFVLRDTRGRALKGGVFIKRWFRGLMIGAMGKSSLNQGLWCHCQAETGSAGTGPRS